MINLTPIREILFAEDDDGFRSVVRNALILRGYGITAAKNGKEALSLFEANPNCWFALITDFNMPFMNGAELIQAIQAKGRSIKPTIVISALQAEDSPELAQLATSHGVYLLHKPFDFGELFAVLDYWSRPGNGEVDGLR